MPNLTLTIDDETLKRARIRAIEDGTSVNAVVRDYLHDYAGGEAHRDAVEGFLAFAHAHAGARSGAEGRAWSREELYEDRLGRYGA